MKYHFNPARREPRGTDQRIVPSRQGPSPTSEREEVVGCDSNEGRRATASLRVVRIRQGRPKNCASSRLTWPKRPYLFFETATS